MSLCIRAASKAKFVDCSGYVDEGEGQCCDHKRIESFPLGQEGLKTGCYVPGKGGRSFYFEIHYSGYVRWFDELYRMVYGVDTDGVCKKFRRYRGKPFIEFVDVMNASDGETIGPKMSANSTAILLPSHAKQGSTLPKSRNWPGCGTCTATSARLSRLPATMGLCAIGDPCITSGQR